jgi:hypothetical protein
MNNKLAHGSISSSLSKLDPADVPDLLKTMSADELRGEGGSEGLIALIRQLVSGQTDEPATQLAYAALLSVLRADEVKIVRDDDGQLWPFVPREGLWRGVLRKNDETQTIEESRFDSEAGVITWVSPWDK